MPDELQVKVSIFFILEIPINALRTILKSEGFTEIPQIQQFIAPGIEIGPPRLPIASFKNTRIEYVGERYLLHSFGPLSEVIELSNLIPQLFEKQKYELDEMTRYCEFQLPYSPIEISGFINSLRSKAKVDGLDKLNELCENEMKPFTLSISNSDTPLNDTWLHIGLRPDVNRPQEVMLLEIVKRTPTHAKIIEFLNLVPDVINEIKEFLKPTN
jgi:hypothetical protein